MAPERHHRWFAPIASAHPPGFDRVTKSVPGDRMISPPAVITYPVADLQGDIVEPSGIDWSDFETVYERVVNLEHDVPVGTAAVEYQSVPRLNAERQPDATLGRVAVPTGVTTFFDSAAAAAKHTLRRFDARGRVVGTYSPDEAARAAEQTYPLVRDGVLSGVSLEFQPDGPEGVAFESLGKSPMLNRPAYHFFRTRAMGYAAACDVPVNPVAGYVPADADTLARAEKALKFCEKPSTLELIRKSLAPLVRVLKSQTPSGRVTAPVRRAPTMSKTAPARRVAKAMYEEDETLMEPPGDMNPDVEIDEVGIAPEPDGDEMKPTPAALFQLAQTITDACAMADEMGSKGEHPQGLKELKKFCDQLNAMAAKITAAAEKVAANLGTGEEVEVAEEVEPEAVEVDEETGVIKSLTFARKGWEPHRVALVSPAVFKKGTPYKAGDLKPVPVKKAKGLAAGQVAVDAEHLKNLETLAELALGGRR